ncbi:MAG: 23S rRNA (uracil(1939)-C(5))-methyltransferase RlmD [Clostridiales bacterium]|nr:23S rRNA (uracil(1939)-C(5))-methyltransferase RlmD [Clostridiales bacterium]
MTNMASSKCVHDEYCGGCIYQDYSYDEQLCIKEKQVRELFDVNAVMCEDIEHIVPSMDVYGYRNKMEYTFGDQVKGGEMTLGMHQKGKFMSIITVDKCQLVDADFNLILRETLKFCNEHDYPHYNKKSHEGLMRNLIIRKGVRTKELIINIVTSSQQKFDEVAFVEMLKNLTLDNNLAGILHTINDAPSDAVICEDMIVLYGRDYYMEKIMGLDFKVSAFSFFQTNPKAVERLYIDALSMIDDFEGKIAYDLFCGTGTISQALALKAKKVVGIELVEEAVESAIENAKLNGLSNCEFIAGDVFKVLESAQIEKPDVIVVDPPRVGIHPKALAKIISYGVDQILYISCNPKTLAIDLKTLQDCAYKVEKTRIYDNFPMTKHVESVVLMSRVAPTK